LIMINFGKFLKRWLLTAAAFKFIWHLEFQNSDCNFIVPACLFIQVSLPF
jgi:hypothetical protein